MGFIGAYYTKLRLETFFFSLFYAIFTGFGLTAGYHRLWAHRSYNASKPVQCCLALMGAAALLGSIKTWSRTHRAHHRFCDTDLDPVGSHMGLYHTHLGRLLVKQRRRPLADVSDLSKNEIVQWQYRQYLPLGILMGCIVPAIIPWLLWGDAKGGVVYAAVLRLFVVQQADFCIDSLAHHFGDKSYGDDHSATDNVFTAFFTLGEGYHNFHHQYPMDYRHGVKWYALDPTKWLIWTLQLFGLASQLKVFPDNEIKKGELTMQLKKLRGVQETIAWPSNSNDLPVINWDSFQQQAQKRPLILISGFIHDVTGFIDEHPGGPRILKDMIGNDASIAFLGGVYQHSNAAHNLLAMKRVGVLQGGHPHILDERAIPPSQRLMIAHYEELSSTHFHDGEMMKLTSVNTASFIVPK